MSQPVLLFPQSTGSDLGIFRANDNYYIPITAYDPAPQLGSVAYNLIELLDGGTAVCTSATYSSNILDLGTSTTGTVSLTLTFGSAVSSSTWLPSDLTLDPETGYIYGYLATQTEYLKKYNVTVSATKFYTTSTASFSIVNTFTLSTINSNSDIITWANSSTLSITQGTISDLSIVATHTETQSELQYGFVNLVYTGNATTSQFTLTNMSSVVGITTGMTVVQLSTTSSILTTNSYVVGVGTSTVTLNQATKAGTIINGTFSFTPYIDGLTLTNTGNIIGQGNTTGTYTATVVAWNPYYPIELFDGGESYKTQDYDVYGGYANSFNGLTYTNTLTSFLLDGGDVDTFGVEIDGGSAPDAVNYDYYSVDGGNALSIYGPGTYILDGGNGLSYYYIEVFAGGNANLGITLPLHNTNGGASASVYTFDDGSTDGGSSQTLYGSNEIFLDGGATGSIYLTYDLDGGFSATIYYKEDSFADCGHAQLIPPFDTSLTRPSYIYPFATQELTINVTTPLVDVPYTGIYVRPFLSIPKRKSYLEFISNTEIFPPNLLYRGDDPNFGVQKDIKMFLEFGIQSINLNDYVPALWENFNRRRLTFGNIKVARAKDQAGNYLYDVIYADIIDNINGVKLVIYDKNNIYYPASIANMRHRLESIVLPNYTYISVDQYHLPKFMQTAQTGTYLPTNYIKVVPLCYVQPGKSSSIIDQIRLSGFDFKLYDFEIDRLIIQNSLDNTTDKYLLFPRNSLTTVIPQDNLIFGDDGVPIPITRA